MFKARTNQALSRDWSKESVELEDGQEE